MSNKDKEVKITVSQEKVSDTDLKWDEKEREKIEERILNLRYDQVAALPQIVGPAFSREDIGGVVEEIREHGHDSINLSALMTEAESKESLLWWVEFFEKHDRS